MTKKAVRALAAAAALVLLAGAAPRGDEPPMADSAAEARAIDQVLTAARLADWGRKHRDPGALIMASRLTDEIEMRRAPDSEDESLLSAARLLDEAAALAPEDAAVQAAVDALRRPDALRGVRSSPFGRGPIYAVKALRAGEVYAFELDARRGEILRVAAVGDGDTNIDLSVRDGRGAVVCRDGQGDHYPVCTLRPSASDKMRIDITNRGGVWTRVQILSN